MSYNKTLYTQLPFSACVFFPFELILVQCMLCFLLLVSFIIIRDHCNVFLKLFYFSLTGRPPFVAETEEKLYELIKKGEVDFSDPCWETCHESGK